MIKKITLKEAANRGYDIYSLLGVDKDTKQLIKNRAVNMAPVVEAIETAALAIKEAPVVEGVVAKVTEIKQPTNTDFEVFSAWCVSEYGRTPSMQDYKDAIMYYGNIAMQSIM